MTILPATITGKIRLTYWMQAATMATIVGAVILVSLTVAIGGRSLWFLVLQFVCIAALLALFVAQIVIRHRLRTLL